MTSADAVLDDGGRIDVVVQHYGQTFFHVLPGDFFKEFGAAIIKAQRHVRTIVLSVNAHFGVGKVLASKQGSILEKVGGATHLPGYCINPPAVVDFVARWDLALEGLFHGVLPINQLEFQQGGLAYQVNRPLRVLDSRQLYQNTIFALSTNVRLANTELIDAVTDRLEALVYSKLFYMTDLLWFNLEGHLELILGLITIQNLQQRKFVFYKLGHSLPILIPRQDQFYLVFPLSLNLTKADMFTTQVIL